MHRHQGSRPSASRRGGQLAPFLSTTAEPGGHEAKWQMGTLGVQGFAAQQPPMLVRIGQLRTAAGH